MPNVLLFVFKNKGNAVFISFFVAKIDNNNAAGKKSRLILIYVRFEAEQKKRGAYFDLFCL